MTPLDLHSKNVFLAGQFVALPRRRLQSFLKAVGATLIRCDHRRYPLQQPRRAALHHSPVRRVDIIVQGTVSESHPSFYPRAAHPDALTIDEQELVESFGIEDLAQERLERLRELVHTPSFAEADWRYACCLLEAAPPGAALDLAVDYLEHRDLPHIRRFPLLRWLERAGAGSHEPRLRVARSLQLNNLGGCRNLGSILKSGALEGVTHLEMGWAALEQPFPFSLLQAGAWPRVETLHIAPEYAGSQAYYYSSWRLPQRQEGLVKLLKLPRWKDVLRRVTLDPAALGGPDAGQRVLAHLRKQLTGALELSLAAQA